MDITCIAGMAVITNDYESSAGLYCETLGLPLKSRDGYLSTKSLDGAKLFGVWRLSDAAKICFGSNDWPQNIKVPQTTIEFELADISAVEDAVLEMKEKGYTFVHDARVEPWGQTVARFISPESVLLGLTYSPWHHDKKQHDEND